MRRGIFVIVMALLALGVSAQAPAPAPAPAAVDEKAAIALFKKQCSGGPGFSFAYEVDAKLDGEVWHVHGDFPAEHPERYRISTFKDIYLDVPVNGAPPKPQCSIVMVE